MNYRHSFHAGNFADVFKHWLLVLLLEKLKQKTTPFTVLETHAGAGFYHLDALESQKTKEYQQGIVKLWETKPPPAFNTYLNIIQQAQTNPSHLDVYPGSPWIICQLLRPEDTLIACELHPEVYTCLKKSLRFFKMANVQLQDAYQAIKAFLPPKMTKRGLIFIDPPFENEKEFEHILAALQSRLFHFSHGIYAIWYPIKYSAPIVRFYKKLQNFIKIPILSAEIFIHAENNAQRLNGCGMCIINPPWQLEETLAENMPWLLDVLRQSPGAKIKLQRFIA